MPGESGTTLWCPHCGAEYRAGYSMCSDCNVALVGEEPLRPIPVGDHDLVRYDLSSWSGPQRATLELLMRGIEVAFEWEGAELLVPAARSAELAPLIDDVGAGVETVGEPVTSGGRHYGWSLYRALDWIGISLALAVVGIASGGIAEAVDLAGSIGAALPVRPGPGVPVSTLISFGTQWANATAGVILLGGVGALVLPRLVSGPPPLTSAQLWPRRARFGLAFVGLVVGATLAAEITAIVVTVWGPGRTALASAFGIGPVVANSVAGVIPTAIALTGAVHGLRISRSARLGTGEDAGP